MFFWVIIALLTLTGFALKSSSRIKSPLSFRRFQSTNDNESKSKIDVDSIPSLTDLLEPKITKKPKQKKGGLAFLQPRVPSTNLTPKNRLSYEERSEIMRGFDSARFTFIADSVFFSLLGLCLVWGFGTFKDAYSYGLGSIFGLAYAILLGRFVENIGGGGSSGGSLRFVPVILLIVLYGKYRTTFSFIPELLGFFSYQVGSLFQIFNEDLYGDRNTDEIS